MNEYRITIKNGTCVPIYTKDIKAKTENEALIEVLKTEIIYSDDTIYIEEI